jgi:replicative DNA helicase
VPELEIKLNDYTRWIDWMPNWLWRFDKSDLVVMAWYPSCWKTEFTYFIARANANIWTKVLYLSLELPPKNLFLRMSRKRLWVGKADWQDWKVSDEQFDWIWRYYNTLKNQKNITVLWYETPPTIDEIEQTIIKYKWMWYDLFFIDNLGKIQWDVNENTRFTEITWRLQTLKNNFDTCIWVLHHLSKPPRWMQYSPWWVTGIRWSQKIIDNATLVFELFRNLDPDDLWEEKSKVQLILYKDTMDWATGTVDLRFNQWDYLIYNNQRWK